MTPIKYIGVRPEYREGAYGSGLVFQQDQTINVEDDELARKLLRHKDVYVLGDAEGAPVAAKQEKAKADDEDNQQDIRDAVANMTKAALSTFAQAHFSATLDARKSVADLRTQVVGLIDQFGTE